MVPNNQTVLQSGIETAAIITQSMTGDKDIFFTFFIVEIIIGELQPAREPGTSAIFSKPGGGRTQHATVALLNFTSGEHQPQVTLRVNIVPDTPIKSTAAIKKFLCKTSAIVGA